MVSSGEGLDEVASDELQQKQSPESKTNMSQQSSDGGVHASEKREEVAPSMNSKQSLQERDGIHISQLDREGIIASAISDKTPSTGSNVLQSGQEGRTPSTPREKLSEDGYHWRKYGQKLVKGNEFIRSYYKCTHSSCQVKKQFERSHDGQITNIVYFGEHDHPKHQGSLPVAVGFVVSVKERAHDPLLTGLGEGHTPNLVGSTNATQISSLTSSEDVKSVPSESNKTRDEVNNDDDPHSKRQKKANRSVDLTPADKLTGEPRIVVQTLSDVDIVNDGYRWRKYGQKLVKGNPNPRSYYRCSSPGCPAKKHVERASHDSKLVIASYEGQHDHNIPPSRTVTHNPTGPNNSIASIEDGDSGAKSGESDICPGEKAKDQLNDGSRSKSKASEVPESDLLGQESKSHEQQNSKSNAGEVSVSTGVDAVINTNSICEDKSNELHSSVTKTESIENSSALGTRVADVNANGQHIQNPEPVQS